MGDRIWNRVVALSFEDRLELGAGDLLENGSRAGEPYGFDGGLVQQSESRGRNRRRSRDSLQLKNFQRLRREVFNREGDDHGRDAPAAI